MKKLILSLIASSVLVSSGFAATAVHTDMRQGKWICTTNASSSDVASDKRADDKMSKNATTASKSFAVASKNCRDCTKITCEVQK